MEKANKRALQLLMSFLDDQQRHDMFTTGKFRLVGSDGVTYEILTTDYSGNVIELRRGRPFKTWCGYPRYLYGDVPIADHILGQVLALKTEAHRFKAIAY